MEKINIAKLLKDCPQGMELDSPVYYNLTFDYINEEQGRIYCKTEDRDTTWFTIYGCISKSPSAKCVIFPKGKTTWEGFHRPFEDGDVVAYGNSNKDSQIFIFKEYITEDYAQCYMMLSEDGAIDFECDDYYVERLATEEEKQKLFQAIKDNGYKWNPDTKTLDKLVEPKFKVGDRIKNGDKNAIVERVYKDFYDIRFDINGCIGAFTIDLQDEWELVPNKFDINTLKPYDKVLVRDTKEQVWVADFFSHAVNRPLGGYTFACIGHYPDQCIPYEENKHLRGTTIDCDEYYKTWEK